jgi:hypothetical protein
MANKRFRHHFTRKPLSHSVVKDERLRLWLNCDGKHKNFGGTFQKKCCRNY